MIVFVFVVVVAVVVAIAALALHNRSERGIESGISSFRRELDALAPRGGATPSSRVDRRPIVSRDHPDAASDGGGEDDTDADAEDGTGDDEPGVRTVQIGERPPMRHGRQPSPPASPAAADSAEDQDVSDEAREETDGGA